MRLLGRAVSNRHIARVLGAWSAAALGTWAFTIVLSLFAYGEGGAGAVGAAVAIRTFPGAVAAPYAALVVDRSSRRRVLVLSAGARGVLLVLTGLAAMAGMTLAVVLPLAALFTGAGVLHSPAQAALLPGLARTPAELAAANVFTSSLDYAGFLVGALVAGAAAAALGLDVALLLCAVPFAAAVVALLGVPADRKPELLPGEEPERPLKAILGGVRAVNADRRLRILMLIFGAAMLVQGVLDVLLVLIALELLGMGDDGVGWLNAGWGAGGLVGGVVALWLLRRGQLGPGLVLGCVLAGVPFALLAAVQEPVAAIALLVVLGVGFAIADIALDTFTQRLTPADVLGRVFGLQETLFIGAATVGSLLAAGLVALAGVEATLVVAGLVLPVGALAAYRPLAALEAGAAVPERAFALLRGVPLFTLLPVASVETLATRARRAEFADGAAIVREGEEGDSFFVIEEGAVAVSVDGTRVRHEAAGEFFGEIALLHRCPRTATVAADGPVVVLAVERADFLDSLAVHGRSANLAHTVAEERLRLGAVTA